MNTRAGSVVAIGSFIPALVCLVVASALTLIDVLNDTYVYSPIVLPLVAVCAFAYALGVVAYAVDYFFLRGRRR